MPRHVRTQFEVGAKRLSPRHVPFTQGGRIGTFPLPYGTSLDEVEELLRHLVERDGQLLEEGLFIQHFPRFPQGAWWLRNLPPWMNKGFWIPKDWWMYQGNEVHVGGAQGSGIWAATVGQLALVNGAPFSLAGQRQGQIVSTPAIVDGKVYIGTTSYDFGANSGSLDSNSGGDLFVVDAATGTMQSVGFNYQKPSTGDIGVEYGPGIGSTPAVTGGRIYLTLLEGKVFCLDSATLATIWSVDLRNQDLAHNQPVDHSNITDTYITGFTSPLVMNERVYVGCGLGEDASGSSPKEYAGHGNDATFGFIYCLDATSGDVIWLFCTCQFEAGVDNQPNQIPPSLWVGDPPAPFQKMPTDPPFRGASVWSSLAYSSGLDRVYVGTGNQNLYDPATGQSLPTPLPGPEEPPSYLYSSCVLSLDATTGQLKGMFQPNSSDSYQPDDSDCDFGGSPTLYDRAGDEAVAIGCKNGSLFLLDADTLECLARRQLLPKYTDGTAINAVDAGGGQENHFGIYGTPSAIDRSIFAGLGGWGIAPGADGILYSTTPFVRALDNRDLADTWPTSTVAFGTGEIVKYSVPGPLYQNANERGLSSPSIANDIVFVATTLPAVYAFDIDTGVCVWTCPENLSQSLSGSYLDGLFGGIMGIAISDNLLAFGCGSDLYVCSLTGR